MSYEFFIKAIQNGGFIGTLCESELKYLHGDCADSVKLPLFFETCNKTGTYFLLTGVSSLDSDKNVQEVLLE